MDHCNMRIGIVGAGRMGTARAQAVSQLGAKVISVCDPQPQMGQTLASRFPDCSVVAEPREMPWSNLDAVCLCTPPVSRGPVEQIALTHRVPVFAEKPIAVSCEQFQPILEQWQSGSVLSAVGYMNRHRPSVRQARDRIATEEVLGLAGNWVCGQYDVPWWHDVGQSGGPVNEQATHMLDLARFLAGDVLEVQALGAPANPLQCAINLQFASGAIGTIFYSCRSADKSIRVQVFTVSGSIHLSGWEFDTITPTHPADPPTRSRDERAQVFCDEIDQFLRTIQGESFEHELCSFEDAFRTQQLVDAVKHAILSGERQRVGHSA